MAPQVRWTYIPGSALSATAYQITVTESRQALLGLQTIGAPATQVQAVYSKPELPILVDKHATHCTLFYPIWLAQGSSKAYTAAFIQVRHDSVSMSLIISSERKLHSIDSTNIAQDYNQNPLYVQGFADTKRLGASGDLPQCTYSAGPVRCPALTAA